jgi:hypothetical protein
MGRQKVKKLVIPMDMKDHLIPHTTNILQALDFSFLGVFKNEREVLDESG